MINYPAQLQTKFVDTILQYIKKIYNEEFKKLTMPHEQNLLPTLSQFYKMTLCHKKYDLSATEISIPILDVIVVAESESEVDFALSCQHFELSSSIA